MTWPPSNALSAHLFLYSQMALHGRHFRLRIGQLTLEYTCCCSQMFGPIISHILALRAHLSDLLKMD
jgi:hypothetical protein